VDENGGVVTCGGVVPGGAVVLCGGVVVWGGVVPCGAVVGIGGVVSVCMLTAASSVAYPGSHASPAAAGSSATIATAGTTTSARDTELSTLITRPLHHLRIAIITPRSLLADKAQTPRPPDRYEPASQRRVTVGGRGRAVSHGGGVSGGPPYPQLLHHVFGVGQRAVILYQLAVAHNAGAAQRRPVTRVGYAQVAQYPPGLAAFTEGVRTLRSCDIEPGREARSVRAHRAGQRNGP
jgi:hypothetical protein